MLETCISTHLLALSIRLTFLSLLMAINDCNAGVNTICSHKLTVCHSHFRFSPSSTSITEVAVFFCSGLNKYLDEQGFSLVGYGCTTCIGNSGDIAEELGKAITDNGEEHTHGPTRTSIVAAFGMIICEDCA